MSEPNYIVKVCLLGEANVGKTSLVYRFVTNKFREDYKATLGVNLLKKDIELVNYGLVSSQIWDLGGQESFQSLRKLYLEGANGALLVYDMTNKISFEKLSEWVSSFKEVRGDQPMILIGNKSDLKNRIEVQEKEPSEYAKNNQMDLIITSAKNGENVEKAFIELISKILDHITYNLSGD